MYLKKAFGVKKPKLEFYGGQAEKVAASSPFDLIINLSGNSLFDTVSSTASLPLFEATVQGMIDTPKLTLTWTDFGLPRLSKSVWESLALDIAALAANKRGKQAFKVAVCCVGGTGRTGTCLAILRALLTGSTEDPVAAIRKTYKFDAVETYSQLTYVELVTGLKTREKVIAKQSYSYTSSNKVSETNPKSAKASAEVFNKANEKNDPVCDSTGIECPASVKHTKFCDDRYHFQKTGQPAPCEDENAEAGEKLTAPVVQGVGIIPCNGEGVSCLAVSHLADCSVAFMAHHKGVIDAHKQTEEGKGVACNDSGFPCPGTLAHSELCRKRNVEHAEALCDKTATNADIPLTAKGEGE